MESPKSITEKTIVIILAPLGIGALVVKFAVAPSNVVPAEFVSFIPTTPVVLIVMRSPFGSQGSPTTSLGAAHATLFGASMVDPVMVKLDDGVSIKKASLNE